MGLQYSRAQSRYLLAIAAAALVWLPAAGGAQTAKADPPKIEEPAKPITERDVGAKDVALTPLSDLGLRKGEVPQLLIDAQIDPYDLAGLRGCAQIAAAVGELDAVLGEDIDIALAKGQAILPGRVAQSVVGSFIPFRGVIRELSGASAQDRRVQAAIYAGIARRSFLKGVGEQRGCRYPARSATPQIIAAAVAEAEAEKRK